MKRGKDAPTSNVIAGDKLSVGDSVLVRGDGAEKPFVGRILAFRKNKKVNEVKLAWYYRPEECRDGRKQFHGEKELFKSNHMDWVEAATISGKCYVHTLQEYRELKDENDTDFFSRFTYTPSIDKFGPENVPVHCVCELPYNPDIVMVMCDECEEWYHPSCINMSVEAVEKYAEKSFTCHLCRQKKRRKIVQG